MKIAFSSENDRGVESQVYSHFGSARFFIIVETEKGAVETVVNQDREHIHSQCQPLIALGGKRVDGVVVGGIGGGALRKLQAAGIKVYRAVEGTVHENLELIKSGRLPEFTLDQTCAGHGPHRECIH
ncbi:MAG: NifB/NifX family molybdenum-iron cluster-binding protein [Deltaproteobacteria bacterium]|nr:NifB/NifX family molybdenum-iron cluster-binding protein [Deltaproteobacteria bacterium]MBW2075584.1 NifB/NifX family molybdenum-iron cluster-binding protein [Deltaproteobacteria bacterium]